MELAVTIQKKCWQMKDFELVRQREIALRIDLEHAPLRPTSTQVTEHPPQMATATTVRRTEHHQYGTAHLTESCMKIELVELWQVGHGVPGLRDDRDHNRSASRPSKTRGGRSDRG